LPGRLANELSDHLAYIDPGSGSLIVQAAIATLVAVPFVFRQQIGRAIRAVRRRANSRPPGGQNPVAPKAEHEV
jgi:hypothetical protein